MLPLLYNKYLMSDSLGDILQRRDMDQPPEIRAIKEYVRRYYDAEVNVIMQPHNVIVAARSAALIGTLRANLPKLQAAANTDKRIMLRIG
jgi:aromatic ring-opening dioxygenase LigB subunit